MWEKTWSQMHNAGRCCSRCMSHRDPETGWTAPLLLGDQRALPGAVTQTESPQAGQEGGEGLSSKKEACVASMNLPPFSRTGAWDVGGKITGNGVKMGGGVSHHPAPAIATRATFTATVPAGKPGNDYGETSRRWKKHLT